MRLFSLRIMIVLMEITGSIPFDKRKSVEGLSLASEFEEYLDRFGKAYSDDEWQDHYDAFLENYHFINNESQSKSTFSMELNRFADMRWDDILHSYFGLRPIDEGVLHGHENHTLKNLSNLAFSVNWTEKGAVTPVKDQGACGSCWAFSSTGALEGAYKIWSGDLVSVSEQELVNGTNGDYGNLGCDGGWMFNAFDFVADHGICTEESVPYTSYKGTHDGPDLYLKDTTVALAPGLVTGYVWVPPSRNALMSVITQRPVSVAIEVSSMSFMLYKSGVLSQPKCGTNVNHAVVATGYGTEDSEHYWLLKNSWSSDWGLQGYILLEMDNGQTYDTCAILQYAFYPVLSDDSG